MSYKNRDIAKKTCISSACIALAIVLPFLTGQIPEIGRMLCPMHLPAFLAGALCGPYFGAAVGVISPILRGVIFGAPPLYPTGVCMAAELLAYAVIFALALRILPKRIGGIYASLLIAVIGGRIVGGIAQAIVYSFGGLGTFGISAFVTAYFVETLPGTLVQFVLIPPTLYALKRAKIWDFS